MRTYPITNAATGRTIAFEIDNATVSGRRVARVLQAISGVTECRLAGSFFSANDLRVTFTYYGTPCVVWEPFGDNSRYWIGPANDEGERVDIQPLEEAFHRVQPFLTAWIGQLLHRRGG